MSERSFYGRIGFRALSKTNGNTARWDEIEEGERAKFETIAEAARAAGVPGSVEHELEEAVDGPEGERQTTALEALKAIAAFRAAPMPEPKAE